MKFQLEGVIPALLTAFTKQGVRVDYERTCALAVRLADQGVHAIFPCGTTGEGMIMTLEERREVLERLIDAVGKRVKVVAHTGAFDTATTIDLTQHAAAAGAYAAGVVTPGYYGYDDRALFAHFKAVAGAVKGFPVLLYNIPVCAKNRLAPELVLRLAEHCDNIVGMKDSGGDISALNDVLAGAPKDFAVINGVDTYTMQALAAGAKGSVASHANVVPHLFLGIFNSMRKGNLKQAWEHQKALNRVCPIFQYGAMPAYYKEGLRLLGFDAGYVRPPHRELTTRERKTLAKALEDAGVI